MPSAVDTQETCGYCSAQASVRLGGCAGTVEVEEEASTPGKPRMVVYRTPAAVRARLARVRVTVVEICG
jgi:hypothetical protein